jgi:hypothetical protein
MNQSLREMRRKAKEIALTLLSPMPTPLYLEMRWRAYNLFQTKEVLRRERIQRTIITNDGWSLKPFDDVKAIFVHVPKCAGDSVSRTLFGNFSGGHITLDQYLNHFEPKSIVSYFKFAIVRNPWDRLVSDYHYLKNGGYHGNDHHRNWFRAELGDFKDFDEFVRGWLNKENIWKLDHFWPQYRYILERRVKIHLDFIGFFENLQEDFRYISEHLGLDCHLQHANTSAHVDYKSYYNEETMNIVADVYDIDIKLLGYNFDNSSLPEQLAKRSAGRALDLTASGLDKGSSQHFLDLY